jgi:large-conductance mechanosensitive channel
MQIQEIITYIIIAIASGFVIVSLYRTLFPSKEKLKQHGCAGSCNCDAKVLRKELLIKIRPIEKRPTARIQN